jgi:hypothetical protein
MRVELNIPESVAEPRLWVKHQPVLAMALRRGSIEMGLRRSEMIKVTYDAGELSLVPRHLEMSEIITTPRACSPKCSSAGCQRRSNL